MVREFPNTYPGQAFPPHLQSLVYDHAPLSGVNKSASFGNIEGNRAEGGVRILAYEVTPQNVIRSGELGITYGSGSQWLVVFPQGQSPCDLAEATVRVCQAGGVGQSGKYLRELRSGQAHTDG